ncbi:MAG: gamma-glutamyl-gamma-aminobutyrate hydrolase family protein, partial [Planctomycetia bacterium]|nr:gamma-glutamyl-gamma-aminobutyrate hydrolase family protein [Planctomycetia bacterium]
GLNADFRSARKDCPAISYVHSACYDVLIRVGAVPVILPPLSDPEDLNRLLNMLDGFVMVGGGDLDPRRDGYMVHNSMRLMDERRETFDRMLIDEIAHRRMPVFGIGAGMQLLNVSQGGTLFYHIPEDLRDAIPHYDPMDPHHRHALSVRPRSLMERVYGENVIRVNSMHHMAVDDVAPGFIVTARCPDGVTEAIESTMDDWFAIGTQFHPESQTASALDVRIFEEFLAGLGGRVASFRLVA